jgi:hypothetical protein
VVGRRISRGTDPLVAHGTHPAALHALCGAVPHVLIAIAVALYLLEAMILVVLGRVLVHGLVGDARMARYSDDVEAAGKH